MSLKRSLVQMIKGALPEPPVTGVEVGVFKGETSAHLIKRFPNCNWYFVDPWKEWTDGSYKARQMSKLKQYEWETVYEQALQRIHKQQPRERRSSYKILRQTSEQAASQFADSVFDVVFIDGNHDLIGLDIDLWLPKLRKGGLFCGHDYGGKTPIVTKTVDERFGPSNLLIVKKDLLWGVIA